MYIFRTNTKNNCLSIVSAIDQCLLLRSRYLKNMFSNCKSNIISLNCTFCIHEVHLR